MSGLIFIGVMDRNHWKARTDIMIIIDQNNKTIEWIPRDLYSKTVNNRINTAYAFAGKQGIINAFKEYNINISDTLLLLPKFFEEAINIIKKIKIPVKNDISFYYPLHRHRPIEEGKKKIIFKSPNEILIGDRFHEWIGARYEIPPSKNSWPDFDRIRRQKILLRQILKKNINFSSIIKSNFCDGMNNNIINILKKIDNSWIIKEIKENDYKPITINKMSVLMFKSLNN
jgi:anionic cell wall polymer biosynthesis LytR-Cps2A-Psr (LCP) family protein